MTEPTPFTEEQSRAGLAMSWVTIQYVRRQLLVWVVDRHRPRQSDLQNLANCLVVAEDALTERNVPKMFRLMDLYGDLFEELAIEFRSKTGGTNVSSS